MNPRRNILALGLSLAAVLAGVSLALLAPKRRLDLLPRIEKTIPIADSMFDGTSVSRILESETGVRFFYQMRPGSTYPWAGVNLRLADSSQVPVDFTSWSGLEVECIASPARALRLQLLADDAIAGVDSRDSVGQIYHAVEFQSDSAVQVLDWSTFSIPSWWRTQRRRSDLQRFDLLDRVRSIEFQNGYLPDVGDSPTTVEIRRLDLVGPDRVLQGAGIALAILGILSALVLGRSVRRSAFPPPLPDEPPAKPDWISSATSAVVLEDAKSQQKARLVEALGKAFADPDLGLESFASAQGLSPRLVAALLKEATGLHFKGALNELRLAEAARLLRETEANVSEIGYAVGFRNPSHFGRAFRERFGSSPTEHRESR